MLGRILMFLSLVFLLAVPGFAQGTFPQVIALSGNTVLGASHINRIIECTAGAGGITLTLPAAATNNPSIVFVKKIDAAAGSCVIASAGSDTIDGATSYTIASRYGWVWLASNGTAWDVIGFFTSASIINALRTGDPDFTIVVFPDTQSMVSSFPAVWESMPNWVAANMGAQNIRAVIGVGDVTDTNTPAEYTEALVGWDVIDATGLPYLPIPGNHDYDALTPARVITTWDTYFPLTRYSGKSWYGGSYAGTTDNWWIKFSVGNHQYLVLGLEFFPRAAVATWAQGIINANPTREVILATHGYQNTNGSRTRDGDPYGPGAYGLSADYDGQELWDNFIKTNSRIVLVLSGHQICTPTSAYAPDAATGGSLVHQLFTDHQCEANGGNGYMLLLKVRPSLGTIEVTTYSASLPGFDASGAYTLSYPSLWLDAALSTRWPVIFGNTVAFKSSVAIEGRMTIDSSDLAYDPLSDGLVFYAPLSENIGTIVKDRSRGATGTLSGTGQTWVSGRLGYGLDFAGLAGGVDFGNLAQITGLTYWSASAWAKTASAPSNSQLLSKHYGALDGEFLLTLFTASIMRVTIINATSTRVDCNMVPPFTITDNQWHFYAGTYDGANISVFADGVLLGTCAQTGVIRTMAAPLRLAGFNAGWTYVGTLDEPRIWNRALSTGEIRQLYLNGWGANGHFITTQAALPVLSACGTGSPVAAAGSTDHRGFFTTGAGTLTSCTMTFNMAYAVPPACAVYGNNAVAVAGLNWTTTTATLVVQATSMTSQTFGYICQ